jgi:RNA polymerase sigma-70 factor (ECF subfamily)
MIRGAATEPRARASQAMDRYAEGDASAFADLYDALAPPLFGFAMNLAHHRATAEDVVQQTFLQMHRGRARWVRGASVFPWAYAIAHHFFLDSARRGRHERLADTEAEAPVEAESEAPPADEEIDARRRLASIERRVRSLPAGLRLAFQLVVLEGLSVVEAAEVVGITPTNLKVRVHRAREALKQDPAPGG